VTPLAIEFRRVDYRIVEQDVSLPSVPEKLQTHDAPKMGKLRRLVKGYGKGGGDVLSYFPNFSKDWRSVSSLLMTASTVFSMGAEMARPAA